MKNFLRFTILLLLMVSIYIGQAQAQNQLVCTSHISKVNVFLNQAQVEREGKLTLGEGYYQIVFEKISPSLIQGSIEAKASDGIEILSVNTQNDFLNQSDKPQFIMGLEDSLEKLNEQLTEIKADKESVFLQKDLLVSNKNIGGANQGVKAEELEDILSIYQKKLQDFKTELTQLNRREKNLLSVKEKIEQQLNEFRDGLLALNNQIVLHVKSNKPSSEARFDIRYLVQGVSWQPLYDIRVTDTRQPIQFLLKANILQSTGENWNNVKLKLTTANPYSGGNKPVLQTAFLYFKQSTPNFRGARSEPYSAPAKAPMAKFDAGNEEDLSTASQNMLSLEFDVSNPVSIASDNKYHLVDLNRFVVPAVYGYAVVPKINSDVFVTAKVQTNDMINQLNGDANIYFNGTYTGKTFLSQQIGDSLTLTLGKEKRVIVKREKVKDMCTKSFFGSNRKDTKTIEISLSHSGTEELVVDMEDQIPVTTNAEIVVKVLETGGAKFNPETGLLSWNVKLQPKQTIKIRFSYELSYPSDKVITDY